MSDTLILHLKKEYYDMVVIGVKRVDYREFKPYWIKRIANGNYKFVRIMLGYNPNFSFLYKYDGISIYDFQELPDYAKLFFIDSEYSFFFGIQFSNLRFNDIFRGVKK